MKEFSEPAHDLVACFLEEVDRRLPGELIGLFLHGSVVWGEFFAGSDLDFVAVWNHLPASGRLDELKAAHELVHQRFPTPAFDGFHCTATDLAASPATIEHRPVFYEGAFDARGSTDINLVTWHELARGPVIVRGQVPGVYTNLPELLDFTRNNLETYWRGIADQVKAAGVTVVGAQDDAVAWIALGAARLHHLLSQQDLTSKSGAGRYIIERLDERWTPIAQEALRIRERRDTPSLYTDHGARGQDAYDLLVWLIQDGLALADRTEHDRDAVASGRVIFMCGPSGSGKTTYAKRLEDQGMIRLSFDEVMWERGISTVPLPQEVRDEIEAELRTRLLDLVGAGQDVVLDFSFWSREMRADYRRLLAPTGVVPETIYLATDRATVLERVRARRSLHADDFELSEELATRYFDHFEPPTPDEGPLEVVS